MTDEKLDAKRTSIRFPRELHLETLGRIEAGEYSNVTDCILKCIAFTFENKDKVSSEANELLLLRANDENKYLRELLEKKEKSTLALVNKKDSQSSELMEKIDTMLNSQLKQLKSENAKLKRRIKEIESFNNEKLKKGGKKKK